MNRKIVYKDISPTAADSAVASISDMQPFSNLPLLFQEDVEFQQFQTCEHNQTILDGTFPSLVAEGNTFALWSLSQSRTDLTFTTPVVLQISFGGAMESSVGITIISDVLGNCWPTHVNIKWYRSSALLSSKDFYPTSTNYGCINQVQYYTDLTITFYALNFSERFLKLQQIPFGIERVFAEDEIESFDVYEAVDLTGVTLSINTMNCRINSDDDVAFMFQRRQPLLVYSNNVLYGSFYLDKWTMSAKKRFSLDNIDYVGLLDSQADYMGGIYTGEAAGDVILDIVRNPKMVTIDASLAGVPLYGWLPISGRRDALAAIAVAIGGVIDSSRGKPIKIYPAPTAQSSNITIDRVYNDISKTSNFPYTGVNLIEHTFSKSQESTELYRAAFSGTITVQFQNPAYNLFISNGTINEQHANYAVITSANDAVETILSGYTYTDSQRSVEIDNPLVTENEQTKVQTFDKLHLVSAYNSAAVAQRLYNYYTKGTKINGSIVLDGEKVSDIVQIALPEGDTATGQIEQFALAIGAQRIKAKAVIQRAE